MDTSTENTTLPAQKPELQANLVKLEPQPTKMVYELRNGRAQSIALSNMPLYKQSVPGTVPLKTGQLYAIKNNNQKQELVNPNPNPNEVNLTKIRPKFIVYSISRLPLMRRSVILPFEGKLVAANPPYIDPYEPDAPLRRKLFCTRSCQTDLPYEEDEDEDDNDNSGGVNSTPLTVATVTTVQVKAEAPVTVPSKRRQPPNLEISHEVRHEIKSETRFRTAEIQTESESAISNYHAVNNRPMAYYHSKVASLYHRDFTCTNPNSWSPIKPSTPPMLPRIAVISPNKYKSSSLYTVNSIDRSMGRYRYSR